MFLPMAGQETTPPEIPQVLKVKSSVSIRTYNTQIKIYQVRIVCIVPLGVTDPMWVMTGIAGGIFLSYVLVMLIK